MSWAAAREQCRRQGMELASVASSTQNQALEAEMRVQVVGQNHFWIGGTDSAAEGSWAWSDGSAWSYSNWDPGGEPNGGAWENCAMVYTSVGSPVWNDKSCAEPLGFACKAAGAWKERHRRAEQPSAPATFPICLSLAAVHRRQRQLNLLP
jgi:hypothetical protein